MSLSSVNMNFSQGSYVADRNDIIERRENKQRGQIYF